MYERNGRRNRRQLKLNHAAGHVDNRLCCRTCTARASFRCRASSRRSACPSGRCCRRRSTRSSVHRLWTAWRAPPGRRPSSRRGRRSRSGDSAYRRGGTRKRSLFAGQIPFVAVAYSRQAPTMSLSRTPLVTVGVGSGDRAAGDHSVGAATVLDDDRLSKLLCERSCHHASCRIGGAASRVSDNHGNRSGRPVSLGVGGGENTAKVVNAKAVKTTVLLLRIVMFYFRRITPNASL